MASCNINHLIRILFLVHFKLILVLSGNCPVSNLACNARSGNKNILVWMPPAQSVDISYDVINLSNNQSSSTTSFFYESINETPLEFEVRAKYSQCSTSNLIYRSKVICLPLKFLVLSVREATSTTISLYWTISESYLIRNYSVFWAESVVGGSWTRSIVLPNSSEGDTIIDLKPDTGYEFYLEVVLKDGETRNSRDDPTVARTTIDTPVSPTSVRVISNNSRPYLLWDPNLSETASNGDYFYTIEYRNRSSPGSPHVIYSQWVNNSVPLRNNTWVIQNIPYNFYYEFRVYATNEIGRGDASLKTTPYLYEEPVLPTLPDNKLLIGLTVSLSIIIITVVIFGSFKFRNYMEKKKIFKPFNSSKVVLNYADDVEIAAIRYMISNLSAAAANRRQIPLDYRDRLALLPRDKLQLGNRLGSGAFGEVFSGTAIIAKNGREIEVAVAVKTLKQVASESEKLAFLMESYVMSFFDHPNIISSIGVCLENKPQYLVLELMEGGDLLNYLRKAECVQTSQLKLSTIDMLEMSVDLASGCSYLASKNIIHRDLAARNCLVSTNLYNTNDRVVKIGDFGLARDLYEGDYYLQEGQTPMPVRWMAPESLSHQMFTVKSDVWSFGVVVWEITSFGKRPYYDMLDNIEVMNCIKSGTKLRKPAHCHSLIFEVIKSCWSDAAEDRPSFEALHENLLQLKQAAMDETILFKSSTVSRQRSFSDSMSGLVYGHDNPSFLVDDEFSQSISSSDTSSSLCNSSSLKYITRKPVETVPKQVNDASSVSSSSLPPENSEPAAPDNSAETHPKQINKEYCKATNNYAKAPTRQSCTDNYRM